jgi:energy-coupling factor transporter ATP-binding protein EcfA2
MLLGSVRRVTDVLLIMDELETVRDERAAARTTGGAVLGLQGVTLVAPDGCCIATGLQLTVPAGGAVLVTGPAGCGKSSLFRTVRDLWRPAAGTVNLPAAVEGVDSVALAGPVFFASQRPLVTTTRVSLLELLSYPLELPAEEEEGAKEVLRELLAWLEVGHLVDRDGWDAPQQWEDCLSLGEQQCLGMARMFFHSPRWAVLDECTSAMSEELEQRVFARAREQGIGLLAFSHRGLFRAAAPSIDDRPLQLTLGRPSACGWSLGLIPDSAVPLPPAKTEQDRRRAQLTPRKPPPPLPATASVAWTPERPASFATVQRSPSGVHEGEGGGNGEPSAPAWTPEGAGSFASALLARAGGAPLTPGGGFGRSPCRTPAGSRGRGRASWTPSSRASTVEEDQVHAPVPHGAPHAPDRARFDSCADGRGRVAGAAGGGDADLAGQARRRPRRPAPRPPPARPHHLPRCRRLSAGPVARCLRSQPTQHGRRCAPHPGAFEHAAPRGPTWRGSARTGPAPETIVPVIL